MNQVQVLKLCKSEPTDTRTRQVKAKTMQSQVDSKGLA